MKKTAVIISSWTAVALCMGLIFFLSSQNASESGSTSHWLLELLKLPVSEEFLRNAAHFLEFTGLAVLLSNAFYQTCKTQKPFLSFIITSAYAATDEFHQLFVEGRACTLSDWLTDSCGALTGVLAACLLIKFFSCIKGGKQID